MKQNLLSKKILLLLLFFPLVIFAQESITGTITEASSGAPLPGANVVVKGTNNGTTSDFDGNFKLDVPSLPVTLVVSSVGSSNQEVEVASNNAGTISLNDGVSLDEVVIVGNRAKPRTVLTSLVPVDNISVQELANTGQPTVDKMLAYRVPSYNSTNQTISDATAHFDPADLRGLGPSRTLVLVNGKRKNQSALVYINDTPGKGEVGVDMKSIPAAALKRVEVLRDGASAQYGSDAIAGVVNMVLREDVGTTTVNVSSGVTSEGDGFNIGADVNTGLRVGDNGGFINMTFAYYQQEETNRAGTPGDDVLFGVAADDPDWSEWLSENPDLGMTIGQPELYKGDLFYNLGLPFKNGKGKLYSFGGVTYREGKSFALYRAPYWVQDPFNLLHEAGTEYQGFQPTFETKITDNNNVIGVEFEMLGFDVDLSGTYGRNAVSYEVNNSINPALGATSPTSFNVGAYTFSNAIANLDFSRSFGIVSLAFGGEFKDERFNSFAGEPESYYADGAQSFPGLQPANAVRADRNNYGVYVDLEVEATDKLLLGGAVRYEDFSDFGDNTSWKVNGRYILGDNQGAIRASYSTGFRAPSLHQIYLSNIQTLVSGGTISNQGTFNNVDPVIRDGLGVPQLTAEESTNISAGITYKVTSNLSLSADFYNVEVENRVLFTGEIGYKDGSVGDPQNPVEDILEANSITSLKFFVNAVDTKTTGVDIVASLDNISLGSGTFGATLAANYNETEITNDDSDPNTDGLQLEAPGILGENGYDIFNRKEQSRIVSSRPQTKVLLGLDYEIGKFNFTLNNTYFGEVTWMHSNNGLNGAPLGPNGSNLPVDDADYDQTFAGKIITDLIVRFNVCDSFSLFASANNLLDVYPDEIETQGDFVTDLGGRFKYPWEVNQFGFNGMIINGGLTYKF
ncbi:MAG: TonB-dependent receptor [Flavobacteriaceae bacterium]|nr:TonB-dependent receptor [Flavobacteriaceae bacterium]